MREMSASCDTPPLTPLSCSFGTVFIVAGQRLHWHLSSTKKGATTAKTTRIQTEFDIKNL